MKYVTAPVFFVFTFLLMPNTALAGLGFKELSMERAVFIALKRNTDLHMAEEQMKMAGIRKREVFGRALPDFDVSTTYRYEGNVQKYELAPGQSFQFQPDDNYSVNAKLEQWIYSGSVGAALRGAKHYMAVARARLKTSENDIITDVKRKFLTALFTREVITAHEASIEQLKSHVADSKSREEVGLNTAYDTMRFETRLAEETPKLIAAQNDHIKASAELLESMGTDPFIEIELVGSLDSPPSEIPIKKSIITALENRPEVKAVKENTYVAREAANAEKSSQFPTVKAFGDYTKANSSPNAYGGFDWRDDWNIGVRLEMNIFDGKERSSRYKQRIADQNIAWLQNEKTRRAILVEVKTAHNNIKRAEEFVKSQIKNVEYAQESYRIAAERAKEGMATQLELMDAQLTLTNAKVNRSRAYYERSMAQVMLNRAIGVIER